MEVKQRSYSISYEVDTALEREEYDNDDYVTKIGGRASVILSDGLSERPARVGAIHGYRVHLAEAAAAGVPIFDVFDTDGSLEAFYHALIGKAGFREEALPNPSYGTELMDILVVAHVEIVKYYRGGRLGHVLAERFIELFGGGCLFVALGIRPLREHESMAKAYRQQMGLSLFEQDPEVARQKLRRVAARPAGGVPAPGSADRLEAYLDESDRTDSTIRTYYTRLKTFFKWCAMQGWIKTNPVGQLQPPKKSRTVLEQRHDARAS